MVSIFFIGWGAFCFQYPILTLNVFEKLQIIFLFNRSIEWIANHAVACLIHSAVAVPVGSVEQYTLLRHFCQYLVSST